MNDPAIRALLYPWLQGGVWVDELPTGSTRADVVHLTEDFMHGYEIKGQRDTLLRVPNQLRCYAEVYDFVTFVVTEKHLPQLLLLLPDWVGILIAAPDGLRPHREARYNATVQPAPLAALLLLEEVKQFLLACGLTGISLLRGRDIARLLRSTNHVPLSRLARHVRQRLMARLPGRLLARAERKAEREQRSPRRPKAPKRRKMPRKSANKAKAAP